MDVCKLISLPHRPIRGRKSLSFPGLNFHRGAKNSTYHAYRFAFSLRLLFFCPPFQDRLAGCVLLVLTPLSVAPCFNKKKMWLCQFSCCRAHHPFSDLFVRGGPSARNATVLSSTNNGACSVICCSAADCDTNLAIHSGRGFYPQDSCDCFHLPRPVTAMCFK